MNRISVYGMVERNPQSGDAITDLLALQRLAVDFARRDRCDWDGLRALFTADAIIHVAFFRGPIDDFIAISRNAADNGAPPPKHQFGYPRVDVVGDRARIETDVQVTIRAGGDAAFDVTSWLRFVDRTVRVANGWAIVSRTAIYERDRFDPVEFGTVQQPMFETLKQYPAQCRYLSFMLSRIGVPVLDATVLAHSDAENHVLAETEAWLLS